MNNFQQLLELESRRMKQEDSDRILQNVWGSLGFLRMLGDVADIYVSKVMDVLVIASSEELPPEPTEGNASPSGTNHAPDQPQIDLRHIRPNAPDKDRPVR